MVAGPACENGAVIWVNLDYVPVFKEVNLNERTEKQQNLREEVKYKEEVFHGNNRFHDM